MIADYNRVGASAIHPRAKLAKSPRSYLSLEQEATFLDSFNDSAVSGELTTTQTIQSAFESQVGTSVAPSTIYRLLERHGWRKVSPRPHHPERDKEAQVAFKQTFQTWFKAR